MYLSAPAVLMTPRQCHLIEKVLHDAARNVTAKGGNLQPEVETLLTDVRRAAEWHRRQVTDASDVNVSSPADVSSSSRTLDTEMVGSLLGVDRHDVADLARRGRLPGRRVRNRWSFEEADVIEYMQERAG